MGLESATYINQLVNSNPTGSDGKSQGDDHLRLIKAVLQNSFPNLTGAMTMTQAQLNAVGSPGALNVPGMITMWYGTEAAIPAGWKLCNGVGTISTGTAVPDLRDKFLVGAGTTYTLGATGGATSHIHTANLVIGGHALTVPELPAHTHSTVGVSSQGVTGGGGIISVPGGTTQTGSTGSGTAHTHENSSATIQAASSLPPYVAVYYIIKN